MSVKLVSSLIIAWDQTHVEAHVRQTLSRWIALLFAARACDSKVSLQADSFC